MAALPWDLKSSDSGVVRETAAASGFGAAPAPVVLLVFAPVASLPLSFS